MDAERVRRDLGARRASVPWRGHSTIKPLVVLISFLSLAGRYYNAGTSHAQERDRSGLAAALRFATCCCHRAPPWSRPPVHGCQQPTSRWREEVTITLDAMKAGIIWLTPENLTAEWLLSEAGALSKAG